MDITIYRFSDKIFPRISSDLHNIREFISCATEIVEVLEKYGMRYCEAQTLLEHTLNLLYRYADSSHSDMQIYAAKEHLERQKQHT